MLGHQTPGVERPNTPRQPPQCRIPFTPEPRFLPFADDREGGVYDTGEDARSSFMPQSPISSFLPQSSSSPATSCSFFLFFPCPSVLSLILGLDPMGMKIAVPRMASRLERIEREVYEPSAPWLACGDDTTPSSRTLTLEDDRVVPGGVKCHVEDARSGVRIDFIRPRVGTQLCWVTGERRARLPLAGACAPTRRETRACRAARSGSRLARLALAPESERGAQRRILARIHRARARWSRSCAPFFLSCQFFFCAFRFFGGFCQNKKGGTCGARPGRVRKKKNRGFFFGAVFF